VRSGLVVAMAVAVVAIAACADGAGPSCGELRDPGALRAFVGRLYDTKLAPDEAAIRGTPEDSPHVLAGYRRAFTRGLSADTAALCAAKPASYRPQRALVRKYAD
jgi:hypothetical protein